MAEARFKCPESDAARPRGGGGTARHVGCGGAAGGRRAAAPPEGAAARGSQPPAAAGVRGGPRTVVPRVDGEGSDRPRGPLTRSCPGERGQLPQFLVHTEF